MKHYKELKDSEDLIVWNGRQIRNTFRTAIAIAAYDANQRRDGINEVAPVVDASQCRIIARSARYFDKYLKLVSSYTDSDIATAVTERDDDFVSTSEKEDGRPRGRIRGGYKKALKSERRENVTNQMNIPRRI
ncbi:hypothetical protein F4823DRAFT_560714 [Ustulina deusta]|nr:hypothetical protein F4823DRAFT_560714 [Ustulina deusta]